LSRACLVGHSRSAPDASEPRPLLLSALALSRSVIARARSSPHCDGARDGTRDGGAVEHSALRCAQSALRCCERPRGSRRGVLLPRSRRALCHVSSVHPSPRSIFSQSATRCRQEEARYTCPSCQAPYCSLRCYRSTTHASCSQLFTQRLLESDAQEGDAPGASEQERRDIADLLVRYRSGAADERGDGDGEEEGSPASVSDVHADDGALHIDALTLGAWWLARLQLCGSMCSPAHRRHCLSRRASETPDAGPACGILRVSQLGRPRSGRSGDALVGRPPSGALCFVQGRFGSSANGWPSARIETARQSPGGGADLRASSQDAGAALALGRDHAANTSHSPVRQPSAARGFPAAGRIASIRAAVQQYRRSAQPRSSILPGHCAHNACSCRALLRAQPWAKREGSHRGRARSRNASAGRIDARRNRGAWWAEVLRSPSCVTDASHGVRSPLLISSPSSTALRRCCFRE
jgi:hypothetical protein